MNYIKDLKDKRSKKSMDNKDNFKPHMMYDPKSGEGVMVKTYDDHMRLKSMGWGH